MLDLEVEPLDLGPDVRAVGLELTEGAEQEPARGLEAARIWSRAIPAMAGSEHWALDFFSHLERLKEYCAARKIAYREAGKHTVVVSPPAIEALAAFLERFERETFGVRAGGSVESGDEILENELGRRGVDAYHSAYPNYTFCAICAPEDGSVVVLSNVLWASEIVRRVRPALVNEAVKVRIASQ